MDKINFYRTKHHAMIMREDLNTHFVRSGFKDAEGNHEWLVFDEDAYELEPWKGGTKRFTTVIIKDTYGIDLTGEVDDKIDIVRKLQDEIVLLEQEPLLQLNTKFDAGRTAQKESLKSEIAKKNELIKLLS